MPNGIREKFMTVSGYERPFGYPFIWNDLSKEGIAELNYLMMLASKDYRERNEEKYRDAAFTTVCHQAIYKNKDGTYARKIKEFSDLSISAERGYVKSCIINSEISIGFINKELEETPSYAITHNCLDLCNERVKRKFKEIYS